MSISTLYALGLVALPWLHPCSACVEGCVVPANVDPVRYYTRQAENLFIGTPIHERPDPREPGRSLYTFVVEQSWKGAPADTLQVWGRGTHWALCGGNFPAGNRYLVYAEHQGGELVAHLCASLRVGVDEAKDRLRSLGPPRHTASPAFIAALAARTGPDGGAAPRVQQVGGHVTRRDGGATAGIRVELLKTDLSSVTDASGWVSFTHVDPGLYHLRITVPGAAPELRLVRIGCPPEDAPLGSACRQFLSIYLDP